MEECWEEPPVDPPIGGGPGGPGGEGPAPGNNNGGGGAPPSNYTPQECYDGEIDYTIPLQPGEDYAIPCSSVEIPVEPIPSVTPTTNQNMLDNLNMTFGIYGIQLTADEQVFLLSNSHILLNFTN